MISTSKIEKAKNLIKKEEKPIIVQSQDDKFNRKILEYGKFDVLLSIESGARKRGLRQIDSGFNHVLGKIASKNKVAIGIDLNELKSLKKSQKAERIERIIQNIKIARKSKTKLAIISSDDKKNVQSFLISLGASTQQAKEAISF